MELLHVEIDSENEEQIMYVSPVDKPCKIMRTWAMPSAWTFTIRPIAALVKRIVGDGKGWIDPFAGENSPAEITNDLNPSRNAEFHSDALDFLQTIKTQSAKGVLYDPPYSFRQAKELYDMYGADKLNAYNVNQMDYWANCKKEIARIVSPGGIVICFGWNSNGLGHNKGFEMQEILIVAHGGGKNDTIVTVEQKQVYQLEF